MTRVKFYKKKSKNQLKDGKWERNYLMFKIISCRFAHAFFPTYLSFFHPLVILFSMCYILNCSRIVSICFLFRLSWFGWCVRKIEKRKKTREKSSTFADESCESVFIGKFPDFNFFSCLPTPTPVHHYTGMEQKHDSGIKTPNKRNNGCIFKHKKLLYVYKMVWEWVV